MLTFQTTNELRLRRRPSLSGDTVGVIRMGAIVYAVGGTADADGLPWLNIAAVCVDGGWYEGWSAMKYDDEALLVGFTPEVQMTSPVLSWMPLTQMFGENPDSYAPFGYYGHNGIDLGTPIGTLIVAVADGTVDMATNEVGGYGRFIRIKHGWGYSLYAHLSTFNVLGKTNVRAGAVIGLSGNGGNSSGPHLHFEIRVNPIIDGNGYGGRVDPLPYINRSNLQFPGYLPEKLRKVLS